MKTLRLSLAVLTLAAASLPVFAAASTEPGADARRERPALRGHRRGPSPARIAERLGLTAEQREQLKTKRVAAAEAAQAIRRDASLTPEQKREKFRETRQATRAELRSVLSPEQQTKLRHLKKRGHRIAHRRGLR